MKNTLKRLRALYALLGPSRSKFWISMALLLAQAAWAGVVLSTMAVFLQSLTQAGMLGNVGARQPLFAALGRVFSFIPEGQAPLWAFLLTALAVAVSSLVETLVQIYTTRFSISFICDLREAVFVKLLRNSQSFHDEQQKGALLNMLMPEVRSCYSAIKTLLNVAVDGFQVGVYGLFAAALSWKLAGLVVLLGAAMLGLNRLFTGAVRAVSQRALKARERLMISAEESLGGVKQIKLLDLFDAAQKGFHTHNRDAEFSGRRAALLLEWQDTAATFLGVGVIACLVLGAVRFRLLEFSGLLLFLYALNQVTGRLKGLTGRYNLFANSIPSVDRIMGFLEDGRAFAENSGAATRPRLLEKELAFEGVGLDYGRKTGILRGIDLTVKRGQTVAFVGASGAGKTSLVNLLVRLYEPTEGRIIVDGTPLRDLDLRFLRSRIGIVNQEPLLFNVGVGENIRMARPSATQEELVAAAREAYADEFIRELPQGYDTPVGDRGVKLSGGQKQRVHIAQLFLKNPEILILDEATSALDSQSEALVQSALQRLSRERTTLIVAHRLATVRAADLIVVLAAGRVVETGTWTQLMAAEGAFYDMVQRQVLAPAEAEVA